MKLKLAAALVAGTAAITMLAGCPNITAPDTGKKEEFKFSPDALISGKVLYDGQALNFADETYKHKFKLKNAETEKGTSMSAEAELKDGMFFEYTSGPEEGKKYQVISDYTGAEPTKASEVNMIRLFVTDPIKAEKAALNPMVTFDLEWVMNPSVEYNSTVTKGASMSFKVDPIQGREAKYQVRVLDSSKTSIYESAFQTTPTFVWDMKANKGTNSGNTVAAGNYFYQILFMQKDKATYDTTTAYFGDSFRIPFKIQ